MKVMKLVVELLKVFYLNVGVGGKVELIGGVWGCLEYFMWICERVG